VIAVVLALKFIPESKAAVARKINGPGQALVIAFLVSLTYAIIGAPTRGWTAPLIIAGFVVAASSLVAFLVWEHRVKEPLVDPRFFRSVPFASATAIAVTALATLGGFLFVNTLYLQDARHLSPLHAGLDILPLALTIMLTAPLSGRIVGRRGSRIPLCLAGIGMAAGCLMLVHLSANTSFAWLFGAYVVFGLGFGFVNAPITDAAVSGMPRAQAGVAAAIATTSRQVGTTLGVAVVGALVSSGLASHVNFSVASRAGWWVMAGCGASSVVLGLIATSSWAHATARRTAESINPEFLEGRST
jgi:MFS family permease